MVRSAIAGRRIVELARILLASSMKLRRSVSLTRFGADDDDLRHDRDDRQRREILLDIVIELLVHARRDCMVHGAHEIGVPVARSARGDRCAESPAGAAAVVDDHLLAELLGQQRRKRPARRRRSRRPRERER
jgi:hypothetical protein